MKAGQGQWPTNGATIKQVDRVSDTCQRRYDRQGRKIVTLQGQIQNLLALVLSLQEIVTLHRGSHSQCVYCNIGEDSPVADAPPN